MVSKNPRLLVRRHRAKSRMPFHRKGAAVAELAVTLPIPLLFLLGTIDTGQFANVYQAVSNASLEGGRVASKHRITSAEEIKSAVVDSLGDALSNTTATELSSVVTVEVTDPRTGSGLGSNLANVAEGAPIAVRVSMPYSAVRIIPGMSFLNAKQVEMTTIVRRQ